MVVAIWEVVLGMQGSSRAVIMAGVMVLVISGLQVARVVASMVGPQVVMAGVVQ